MAAQGQDVSTTRFDRRQRLETQLLRKATEDASFRQQLLTNPKEVIASELGITFPETVTLQIHEETPTSLHLVLPVLIATTDELADEELEAVAGGAGLPDLPDQNALLQQLAQQQQNTLQTFQTLITAQHTTAANVISRSSSTKVA